MTNQELQDKLNRLQRAICCNKPKEVTELPEGNSGNGFVVFEDELYYWDGDSWEQTGGGDPLPTFKTINGETIDDGPGNIVAGQTGQTFNVSTLWDMACAAGCDPTYHVIGSSENIFDNASIIGTTLTYDILGYATNGTYQIIIQRSCGTTKTLSTLNVNISAAPSSIQLSEYAYVYKDTQTFTEGLGATKLDFGGTVVNSTSSLATSIPNSRFTSTGDYIWDVSYSGHLTFETALASTQRIVIAAYLDGVLMPQSRQTIVVPEGTDYQIPFSKSWIQQISTTDTFDLRFDATIGDITSLDTVLTLKQISYSL